METIGIICEYDPFHRGHEKQLSEAKKRGNAKYTICCMSGSFTQRGEAAVLDKWTRAEAACVCGADVVVELPLLFALRPARDFAFGGVSLLRLLGCEGISFGSELSLPKLEALLDGDTAAEEAIGRYLKQGYSHPRAREAGYREAGLDADAARRPNATLGLEYLRANRDLGACLEPVLVARESEHNGDRLSAVCSGTAIRKALWEGKSVQRAVPEKVYSLESEALGRQGGMAKLPEEAVFYALRRLTAAEYGLLPEIGGEGLDRRLYRCAQESGSLRAFFEAAKCKRYPLARLRRIVCAVYLGLTRAEQQAVTRPYYGRLLAFREEAFPLLREWKRREVPILTKAADFQGEGAAARCFSWDCRAQDFWGLCCTAPELRAAGRDFRETPRIVGEAEATEG